MHRTPSLILCLTMVWTLVTAASAGQPASFQGLGDLPGGDFGSWAWALTDDGSTVLGWSDVGEFSFEAFRWTQAEGIDCLRELSGACVEWSASGISGHGSVVTGHFNGGLNLRWTLSGGIEFLDPDILSWARAMSPDGSVIVGSARPDVLMADHAFRWTEAEGVVDLGLLGGLTSGAHGVSADGSVVVGISETDSVFNVEAFRWTEAEGMVGLGGLFGGATQSMADAISADGSVIVGGAASLLGFQAFRWTQEGGMVGLGILPGRAAFPGSHATAVSADGSVIVGMSTVNTQFQEVFIWDATHGIRNLREVLIEQGVTNVADWILDYTKAISADGQTIAGGGTNPNGDPEAWIATLPLHPSACSADLDGDGEVNAADLAQLLGAWGSNPGHPADFNGDDVVNAADLAQLLGAWGPC